MDLAETLIDNQVGGNSDIMDLWHQGFFALNEYVMDVDTWQKEF